MVICQTPLRISFAGGGTDIKDYYQKYGGMVLSTTIDKYIYVMVKKRFDDKIVAHYKETEIVDRPEDLKHNLIREALLEIGIYKFYTKIDKGIEISVTADIPSTGTGLGSSSTLTVGLIHALCIYRGFLPWGEMLARKACLIEIDTLGLPIGRQDQYAAAYGGFNLIKFPPNEKVTLEQLEIEPEVLLAVEQNLLLFYSGIARKSSQILSKQKRNIPNRTEVLDKMKQTALAMQHSLKNGNLDEFGKLLDIGWKLKKQMESSITNPIIDAIYEVGKKAGAVGGKITGAGGGGFILFYCPVEKQAQVRKALKNLRELPFRFDRNGSQVIFNRY